jgi:hypothetical protein
MTAFPSSDESFARLHAAESFDGWQQDELALLGTLPDDEVAPRIGRTVNAVRVKRTRLRIPTASDGRRRQGKPGEAGTRGRQRGE